MSEQYEKEVGRAQLTTPWWLYVLGFLLAFSLVVVQLPSQQELQEVEEPTVTNVDGPWYTVGSMPLLLVTVGTLILATAVGLVISLSRRIGWEDD